MRSPENLAHDRGTFQIVAGKVLSAVVKGGRAYLNFSDDWKNDFTVTIAKRNARNFTAVGLDPQALKGRRVRIRGWLDERGGPWIEATRPEQIELADGN